MELQVADNILTIIADANLYSESVLFKCFYWYGNIFEVDITRFDAANFKITLKYVDQDTTPEWDNVILKLKKDLVDFKLRQIVTEETSTIRELIIAKAFAYYEHEDTPMSSITDPVGFDPQSV
jgi:His-Xaa-Ser system protein HxsD